MLMFKRREKNEDACGIEEQYTDEKSNLSSEREEWKQRETKKI